MKTSKFSRMRLLGWSTASLFLGGMIRSSDLLAAHLWRMWVKTKFRSLNWTRTPELAEISSSSAVSLTSTLRQRSSGFQANQPQILIFLQPPETTWESGKLPLMENQSTWRHVSMRILRHKLLSHPLTGINRIQQLSELVLLTRLALSGMLKLKRSKLN